MKYTIKILLALSLLFSFCQKDGIERITKLRIDEVKASNSTEINVFVSVIDLSEKTKSEFGICYSSTSLNPTINNTKLIVENMSKSKLTRYTIKGLNKNTTYYFRFYTIENREVVYSEVKSGQTLSEPELITISPIVFTNTSAKITGSYNTNGIPSDIYFEFGETNLFEKTFAVTSGKTGVTQTVQLEYEVNELKAETYYFFRLKAVTDSRTYYSNVSSFLTDRPTAPEISITRIFEVHPTIYDISSKITNDGGAAVISCGLCWNTTGNPDLSSTYLYGTCSGDVRMNSLLPETTYYIRAFAQNKAGLAYSIEHSFTTPKTPKPEATTLAATDISQTSATLNGAINAFGYTEKTSFEWGLSTNYENTINANWIYDGTARNSKIQLTDLYPETVYNYRVKVETVGGIAYGENMQFETTSFKVPEVTTAGTNYITPVSAIVNSIIKQDYGLNITERGVCWSTHEMPTKDDFYTTDINTVASFICNISELNPNTTYYIRAWARNLKGIGYGNQLVVETPSAGETVTDIDNNTYNVVKIDNRYWMKENLRTTRFNNGTEISYVNDNETWYNFQGSAYCWYDNNLYGSGFIYGNLYNYYAASDYQNICPTGWHVPTESEVQILASYLGGTAVAGGKMKKTGYDFWSSPNEGATDVSGFSAIAGGTRNSSFDGKLLYSFFWTKSDSEFNKAIGFYLHYSSESIQITQDTRTTGKSIRCIKD